MDTLGMEPNIYMNFNVLNEEWCRIKSQKNSIERYMLSVSVWWQNIYDL